MLYVVWLTLYAVWLMLYAVWLTLYFVWFPDVVIVRALYDYQPRQNDDLPFAKGDLMEIDPNT